MGILKIVKNVKGERLIYRRNNSQTYHTDPMESFKEEENTMKKLSLLSISFSLAILFAVAILSPVAAQNSVEDQYGNLVEDNKTVADFQSYLKDYPRGKSASNAKLRVRQLSGKPTNTSSTTTATPGSPGNTPAGFSDYEVVQASATTGAPGTLDGVSVVCPGNKKVLGGGYWSNSGLEVARVWRSYPVDAGGRQNGDRGWVVDFTSVMSGQLFWVRAVCASMPTAFGLEVISASSTTGAAGTLADLSVDCPGNKKVLGGGYSSGDGIENWRVWRNSATGARRSLFC